MASGSVPQSLRIDGTITDHGSQAFTGVNLGTINYGTITNSASLDDVLRSLPTAKGASVSAYERQHDPTCLPDTRVDVLSEIYEWADSQGGPGVFWLSGLAGTGKSTIARTVALHFRQIGRLAASFFFSRAGGDVNHAGKFFTSIAFQLATNIPALKSSVCEAISKNSDIASQAIVDQWRELVINPLSSGWPGEESKSNLVLVVDALDECDGAENVELILSCLANVQSKVGSRLRVFLTSRPEAQIQSGFIQAGASRRQDVVLHHIEPTIIEQDISVFLKCHLEAIGRRCLLTPPWPDEREITVLVQNSGGLFIWAATACRFIEEDNRLAEVRLASLLRRLSSTLPPERKLDEIYTSVLVNSIQGEYEAGETEILQEDLRQVLGPIAVMQDRLSIASFAQLLGKDVSAVRRILNYLHAVLDVPDDDSMAIRLLHPSFQDFLLDPSRCADARYRISEPQVNLTMVEHCVKAMSRHLRRDVCCLRRPAARAGNLSSAEKDRYIPQHVQYACRFWMYHYAETKAWSSASYNPEIEGFLRRHFLHWVESLAILGRIPEALDRIPILEARLSAADPRSQRPANSSKASRRKIPMFRSLAKSPSPHGEAVSGFVQALIDDASSFIWRCNPILKRSPLQLYYASLVFSPSWAAVKQTFAHVAPAWIKHTPDQLEHSDISNPYLQSLEGHSGVISTMTFSPDGKKLASASWDGTVIIWDVAAGLALQTLGDYSSAVIAAAFSPDNKTLASATRDRIIRLWDVRSGTVLRMLAGHSDVVDAVAFSPDGKTLASMSWDRTIKIWNARSGSELNTFDVDCATHDPLFTSARSWLAAVIHPASSPLDYVADEWIKRRGQKLLWIPPQYRHGIVAVHKDHVGFGYSSGRVSWLSFAWEVAEAVESTLRENVAEGRRIETHAPREP